MPSKRELYIRDRDDFIKLLISVESYKGAIKKILANISVKVVEIKKYKVAWTTKPLV